MALGITLKGETIIGRKRAVSAFVDFDNSYPAGGEEISGAQFGLSSIDEVLISNPTCDGYLVGVEPGTSTGKRKLKVYNTVRTPTLAEALTVANDKGTLAALPSNIIAIHGLVGATSTNFRVVAAARTLATGECKVNYTTGEITFFGADDPTSVTVDYIPLVAPVVEASGDLSGITGLRVLVLGV